MSLLVQHLNAQLQLSDCSALTQLPLPSPLLSQAASAVSTRCSASAACAAWAAE